MVMRDSGRPVQIQRTACFDPSRQYRYRLERRWDGSQPAIALIMLNPSRADHQQDDPTLRRCIRLAQDAQFGHLVVVNLFAYCTASPKILQTITDPVGDDNDDHIRRACASVSQILLAWGNYGGWQGRDRQVLDLLQPYCDRLYHLGHTRQGQPRHPLYLPRDTPLLPWTPA